MKRRDFIKTTGITATGLTAATVGSCSNKEKKSAYAIKGIVPANAKARKIVFIMTDTTRRDMLGCYGNKDMKTPNLDKLASEGMRFERAYTCSPVSSPARGAIFTGTYPHTNAVWGNDMPLGDNIKTIGQRLSDNGYHCGYMGKWHLSGSDYFDTAICPAGWDPEFWYDERVYLNEMPAADCIRSRKNSSVEPEEFTFGHKVANKAIDFLNKHGSEAFFLSVSFDEPHGPCICPQEYHDMYKDYEFPVKKNTFDNLDNKPELQKKWSGDFYRSDRKDYKIINPPYFGSNSFADHEIGRILEKIDKVAPDALIFFTSDHGDMLGSHSIWSKGPAVYNEITNIPYIVRWKGKTPAGSVSKDPVSHINIVPTILDAAGLTVSDFIQGKSIVKTLLDPGVKPNEAVFIEFGRFEVDHDGFGGFQPLRCIFDGRYKLNINLFDADELYDLESDPDEMTNLISSKEHEEIRNSLHDKLLDWQGQTRDPFRGWYWACRPWRPEKQKDWWDDKLTRSRPDDGYLPRVLDYENGLPVKEYVRKK
jgi:uncharacterized sulfatase